MKLDEIYEQWGKDSEISIADLGNAALHVAKLHHKYYQMFSNERLVLRKLELEHKELRHQKFVFLTDGPTEEQINAGWKLPPRGKILKTDVQSYMDADQDLIKSNLKLAYQKEKVDVLESIIKTIDRMGFNIKCAIDFERFKAGA